MTARFPDSCKPATKAALQGVLTSIAATVERVFEEADTLAIPRSVEEIEAEEEVEDVERRSARYGNKIVSHGHEFGKSKTVFGREYERSRVAHYKQKKEALLKSQDLENRLKAAGQLGKKQIDEVVVAARRPEKQSPDGPRRRRWEGCLPRRNERRRRGR